MVPAPMRRTFAFAGGGTDLIQQIKDGTNQADVLINLRTVREAREVFEREYLAAQIMRFGGNISRTAAFIGMERSALHRKLKSLGVSPSRGGEDDIEEAVEE
jgi:DNA-binding NtrC family response regulator